MQLSVRFNDGLSTWASFHSHGPEEDERMRSLVAKGASVLRASLALKRNKASVTIRAESLVARFRQ
jgi:hypothetical protein